MAAILSGVGVGCVLSSLCVSYHQQFFTNMLICLIIEFGTGELNILNTMKNITTINMLVHT